MRVRIILYMTRTKTWRPYCCVTHAPTHESRDERYKAVRFPIRREGCHAVRHDPPCQRGRAGGGGGDDDHRRCDPRHCRHRATGGRRRRGYAGGGACDGRRPNKSTARADLAMIDRPSTTPRIINIIGRDGGGE